MAPARRRGSARGAAEAAAVARKQWKVGDLVLAKMKGFPPWPAMVSDPKKWGYSSNRKKLLVFFFGTEQIAFCNHIDLEPFTEERKRILLTKRQGKGADFVRAVEEIVVCFEGLQKQNCDINFTADDSTAPDPRRLEESICKLSMNSKMNTESAHASQSLNYDPPVDNSVTTYSEDNSVSNTNIDSQTYTDHQQSEKCSAVDQVRLTRSSTSTSLRKRPRNALSRTCTVQEITPSLRKCRSSKKDDPFLIQRTGTSTGKVDPSDISVVSGCAQDELATGKMLVKESLEGNSVCSNSHEDICSEIITAGNRNITHSDGSAPTTEQPTLAHSYKDNMINGQVDQKMRPMIVKKTRKPNKNRFTGNNLSYCTTNETMRQTQQVNGDFPGPRRRHDSVHDTVIKAGGDDHLPLVKRARVRMAESSFEEKQSEIAVGSVEANENPCKLELESSDKDCSALSDNGVITPKLLDVNKPLILSSSNECTKSECMFPRVASYPLREITVDAEAALPPSKRLHRALEAMSANVSQARGDNADGTQDDVRVLDVPETLFNGSKDSPGDPPFVFTKGNRSSLAELHEECSSKAMLVNNTCKTSNFQATGNKEEHKNISPGIRSRSSCLVNRSPDHENLTTVTSIGSSSKDLITVSSETVKKNVLITQPGSSESTGKQINETSCLNTVEMCFMMDGAKETLRKDGNYFDETIKDQGAGAKVNEKVDGSIQSDTRKLRFGDGSALAMSVTDVTLPVSSACSRPFVSGNIKFSISGSKEQFGDSEIKQSTKYASKDLLFSPDSTPMKALVAAARAKRLSSRSTCLPNSVADFKLSSDGLCTPSPFGIEDSSDRLSSHSEKNYYQYNSNRSPDTNPQHKNCTHQSESNCSRRESLQVSQPDVSHNFSETSVASSALKSFEGLVCTLTRAKESICRATQCAINCAKLDVASEVVEIILRNLDKEPNLHRRVDMFFLVDSITRYCRGQKGVAGDIYPSLLHSVLGRLLSSAAPPGNTAWENRRQCIKVLRLWLEQKTLSESVLRHHIRALESVNEGAFSNGYSRRQSRTERPLDDPVREMEGMLVDEYGSNTSFQLPGLLHSHVFKDTEGSDSDEKSFEAVTPDDTRSDVPIVREKQKHILEDVDGELEMEDVSPTIEYDSSNQAVADDLPRQFQQYHALPYPPPLPEDKPPSPPPLPASPPPMAPPCASPSFGQSVPSTDNTTADFTVMHPYTNNDKTQKNCLHSNSKEIVQNPISLPSDTATFYAPGYRDHSKHTAPPVSSLCSSCSYESNNCSHTLSNQGNNDLQMRNEPASSKAYHQQHPSRAISSHCSYMHSEPQRQAQPWGNYSSSPVENHIQFENDRQVFNHYNDRRGMVQHENGGFPPVPPGHIEKNETSTSLYYGAPPESFPLRNPGWSHPPEAPKYQYPVPRPMQNHKSRTTGAHAYWGPR